MSPPLQGIFHIFFLRNIVVLTTIVQTSIKLTRLSVAMSRKCGSFWLEELTQMPRETLDGHLYIMRLIKSSLK
jgi:ubiquinone biosynthesis protein Coq4